MLNKKSWLKLCIYTRNKASDKYSFPRENGYFFHYSTGNAEKYHTITEAFFDGYFDTEENLKKPHYLPSFQKQIFYADEIAK